MFRKRFIDQLKQKYANGGTPNLAQYISHEKESTDWPAISEGLHNLYNYGKNKLISSGKALINPLVNIGKSYMSAVNRPLTEKEESLSYLSDIKGTSIYNKLQKLSDSKKKKLYREYEDVLESTEGLGDAGLIKQIKAFKNLDLSGIKELQESADINKSELRNLLYDKIGYHNMGYIKQKAVNAALSAKGFKRGGIAYKTGGTQLEGGVMLPIPGTDAVEFKGNTHEEGGILIDEKTEVENNETMDKVIMNKGGKKDYFFSSYLKKGGVSFANLHKQLLATGGTQKEINLLAKMQEKVAKRDPKQIARLGGIMKYEAGGVKGNSFKIHEEWRVYQYKNGKWYVKLKRKNSTGDFYTDVNGAVMYDPNNNPFNNFNPVGSSREATLNEKFKVKIDLAEGRE